MLGRHPLIVVGVTAVVMAPGLLAGCSSGNKTPTSSQRSSTSTTVSPSSSSVTQAASSPSATASTQAAQATGLSGTWKGTYSGVDQGTFVVNWTQSSTQLHGTINLSGSSAAIPLTGTVHGSTITFGTVGTTAVTYSGKVSGNSMAGTYRLNGSLGGPWSATRAQ